MNSKNEITENNTQKLALLIDADNISSHLIGEIISETGKYGKVTVRRAYGDFSSENLKKWKEQINIYAIRPMQKFAYTSGKNSSDSALIIDAMDIMHEKSVTGFCIVSSDSDFTGLALRIREEGLFVLGIGKSSTPQAFQKACEIFVFTENLAIHKINEDIIIGNESDKVQTDEAVKTVVPKKQVNQEPKKIDIEQVVSKIDKNPIDLHLIERAVKMALQDDELAYMGTIGEKLRTLDPSFDTRSYGFGSLTAMFKSMPGLYELVYRNNGSSLYIKPKFLSN